MFASGRIIGFTMACALVAMVGCGKETESEGSPTAVTSTPSGNVLGTDGGGSAPAESGAAGVDGGLLPSCDIVEFTSPVVEAKVRELVGIGTGPLPGEEVRKVTSLGGLRGADSLDGVECMPSLTYVGVLVGELTDIEAVRTLTRLEEVLVPSNRLTDLSPLSGKTRLVQLEASSNQIEDLSSLILPDAPAHARHCDLPDIELRDNPLDATDVSALCAQGWTVGWGSGVAAVPYEICNSERIPRCVDAR